MTEAEARTALKGVSRDILADFIAFNLASVPDRVARETASYLQKRSLELKKAKIYKQAKDAGMVKE